MKTYLLRCQFKTNEKLSLQKQQKKKMKTFALKRWLMNTDVKLQDNYTNIPMH